MNRSKFNSPQDGDNSKKKKKTKSFQSTDSSRNTLVYCPSNNDSSFNSHSSLKNTTLANPTTQEDDRSTNCLSQDETNNHKKRQRHKKKVGSKNESSEKESTLLHIDSSKPSVDENKKVSFTKELSLKEETSNTSPKISLSPVLKSFEGSVMSDNTMYKDVSEKLQSNENGPLVVSKEKLVKQLSRTEPRIDNEENGTQKSKAELRKERRAMQEAQRAAKAAGKPIANLPLVRKASLPSTVQQVPKRVSDSLKLDDEKVQKKIAKKLEKQQIPQRTTVQKKVGLFSHLYQYEHEISLTQGMLFSSTGIHPAIIKLGLQYAEGVTCGSNARCISLLTTFKKVIADYVTPPQKELCRDLEAKIKPYINFLTQCRPLSVSMSNAIKYIKWHITHIPRELTDAEAKVRLFESIDNFYKEKIILADEAISKNYAFAKISDGDVILTYAFSSLVCKVLCDAYDSGKKFQVIVTDARPKMEGQELLRRLVRHGIQCSYILISAVSYIMREVSKVFLGAHALQANGYVMSRVGSSQISLVAKAYNVPVLVCCETYKFCERVQTDAFVCNELGDPDDLVSTNTKETYLSDWRDIQQLNLLNLVYDVTPPDLVAMVITELGMLPCTSVPVVLRVKHAETSDF